MKNNDAIYIFYVFLSLSLVVFNLKLFSIIKIPLLRISVVPVLKMVNIIFLISIFLLTLFTIQFGGIDTRSFDFSQVYELRSEVNYGVFWGYLINWLGKAFIPLCIVIYYFEKQKSLFVLSITMQLYLYLCVGHKTYLLSIGLIMIIMILLEKNKWNNGMAQLYTVLILISIILYKLATNITLISLLLVRQLGLPQLISYKYYDFFSENQYLNYSEGLLGKLFNIESPYNIKAAYIISGKIGNNENTGFLSDAYSNGGLLSMLIISLIFSMILLFIDSITQKSADKNKYIGIMSYPIIILNDGSLLTTLFTGGLLFLLLFIYLMVSEENVKREITLSKRN